MAHAYTDKFGKVRVHLDNAGRMREKVIEMQEHFADLPKEYQAHPDVQSAIQNAFRLRVALESML